jgi:hypothetical protein
MKKIWLIFFIYGFSGVGNAQTAREILQMAVAASGGSLWQQPETLELHGTALFTPYGKQIRPIKNYLIPIPCTASFRVTIKPRTRQMVK